MGDNLPTVWKADPHTIAKHAILRGYLDAWFPILSRQSAKTKSTRTANTRNEILFIDAFAGPGEYSNGEPGSPIIALRAANEHNVEFPVPIRLLFVEKDAARLQHLKHVIEKELKNRPLQNNVRMDEPQQGEAALVIQGLLNRHENEGIQFGPALAFMDQFGYSAVPMQLVARFMQFPRCEIFTYLNYSGMNRWIQDDSKADGFTRAFGDERWLPAKNMAETEQRRFLLQQYLCALNENGRCDYVFPFAMFDSDGQLLYWLIFCTQHIRGLEVMKKAMWKVDKTGSCRFSDKDDPSQLRLLSLEYSPAWLAETLRAKLAGRKMTVAKLKEFALTDTPCYLFRAALRKLELDVKSGMSVISAPDERKAGSFPDDWLHKIVVEFS